MDKIIIGLVGQLASGKSAIGKYLIEKHGAASFGFSHPLRMTADLFDIEQSRENLQELSTLLRQKFGEEIVAQSMAKRIKQSDDKMIVIDGVRRFTDIDKLKDFPGFHLVNINTDVKTRFERNRSRNQNAGDKEMTFEEFAAREKQESELQIPEVAKTAEYTIENDGTLEELYEKVENVLKQIKGS